MAIVVILLLILAVIIVFSLFNNRRNEEAMYIAFATQKTNTQKYIDDIKMKKKFTVVDASIYLKKGEEAYLDATDVSLIETKSVRVSERTGGAVRIFSGVYLGSSTGISRSHDEFSNVDTGSLTLTNQRLVFNGFQGQRILDIKKLVSTTVFKDNSALLICSENRQKNQMYDGIENPMLWGWLLSCVKETIETNGQLPMGASLRFEEDKPNNNNEFTINTKPRTEAEEPAVSVDVDEHEHLKGSNIIRYAGKVCHLSCRGQSYNIRYLQEKKFVVIDRGNIEKLKNLSSQIIFIEKAPRQAITNVSFWNEYFLSKYSEDRSSQEDS